MRCRDHGRQDIAGVRVRGGAACYEKAKTAKKVWCCIRDMTNGWSVLGRGSDVISGAVAGRGRVGHMQERQSGETVDTFHEAQSAMQHHCPSMSSNPSPGSTRAAGNLGLERPVNSHHHELNHKGRVR
jgi:hypothetical protein